VIGEDVPVARVRGRPWARFVTGPVFVTSGSLQWAISQAIAACLVQAAWFVVASGIGGVAIVAIVLTVSIQWTITTVAMTAVAQLAPMLHRQSRRAVARAIGVVVSALTAWTIEMVAAGSYVTWFEGGWRDSFYFVAAGTGALWGLWLPGVGRSSMSVE